MPCVVADIWHIQRSEIRGRLRRAERGGRRLSEVCVWLLLLWFLLFGSQRLGVFEFRDDFHFEGNVVLES